jgi:hypothetical protein
MNNIDPLPQRKNPTAQIANKMNNIDPLPQKQPSQTTNKMSNIDIPLGCF